MAELYLSHQEHSQQPTAEGTEQAQVASKASHTQTTSCASESKVVECTILQPIAAKKEHKEVQSPTLKKKQKAELDALKKEHKAEVHKLQGKIEQASSEHLEEVDQTVRLVACIFHVNTSFAQLQTKVFNYINPNEFMALQNIYMAAFFNQGQNLNEKIDMSHDELRKLSKGEKSLVNGSDKVTYAELKASLTKILASPDMMQHFIPSIMPAQFMTSAASAGYNVQVSAPATTTAPPSEVNKAATP